MDCWKETQDFKKAVDEVEKVRSGLLLLLLDRSLMHALPSPFLLHALL